MWGLCRQLCSAAAKRAGFMVMLLRDLFLHKATSREVIISFCLLLCQTPPPLVCIWKLNDTFFLLLEVGNLRQKEKYPYRWLRETLRSLLPGSEAAMSSKTFSYLKCYLNASLHCRPLIRLLEVGELYFQVKWRKIKWNWFQEEFQRVQLLVTGQMHTPGFRKL